MWPSSLRMLTFQQLSTCVCCAVSILG